MENKASRSVKEEQVKVNHTIDRVKLQDFGYEKSGTAKGDPDVFVSYLNRIFNGDLVDEKYKGLTDEERNQKRKRLKEVEAKVEEYEKGNEKIEVDIKEKEKKVETRRQELLQLHEERAKDHDKMLHEAFSPLKFGINLFLLLALTGYLFFFYVSAAYKALYVDMEKIASDLAEGLGTGTLMPQPYELSEALRYNYLLFLIPFVFYGFGWAFHILISLKQKIKILYVSLLIAVTFVVDFLLALLIHNNTESAKELMGLSTMKWTQSSTFYIILFMGFVVYIIWSILLDSLLREWAKRQITANLSKIIKHLRKDIKVLENKLIPLDEIRKHRDILSDEIDTYVYGNVKGYIDQFSTGWISYLAPNNLKDVKENCLDRKREFEEKHNIRPGIIKVIKKRTF